MERLSSTEANKKLEALQRKKQKLEQELQEAKENALAAEQFENSAKELGTEIMSVFDINDKKLFLEWLLKDTDRISGIKKKQINQTPLNKAVDESNIKHDTEEAKGSADGKKGVI